jgi:hypothetical protein
VLAIQLVLEWVQSLDPWWDKAQGLLEEVWAGLLVVEWDYLLACWLDWVLAIRLIPESASSLERRWDKAKERLAPALAYQSDWALAIQLVQRWAYRLGPWLGMGQVRLEEALTNRLAREWEHWLEHWWDMAQAGRLHTAPWQTNQI